MSGEGHDGGNVWAALVTGCTALAALAGKTFYDWRKDVREKRSEFREKRRQARDTQIVALTERDTEQVRMVLAEWEKQRQWLITRAKMADDQAARSERRAVEAEAHEEDCERRCEAMETRITAMEFDMEFLDAYRMECEREIHRLTKAT